MKIIFEKLKKYFWDISITEKDISKISIDSSSARQQLNYSKNNMKIRLKIKKVVYNVYSTKTFFFILGANFWKIGHSGTHLCRWEFCFVDKCDGPKV